MQMPAGLLYTKIIEAQNVPNMDWLSKTDAYVELFIRGRRKRFTKVDWNSLNPRHAQIFQTDQMFLCCLWGASTGPGPVAGMFSTEAFVNPSAGLKKTSLCWC